MYIVDMHLPVGGNDRTGRPNINKQSYSLDY